MIIEKKIWLDEKPDEDEVKAKYSNGILTIEVKSITSTKIAVE